jgi:hypothetical protein
MMFSATGVSNPDDIITVGRCSTGGLWFQVIEGEDQEGRGAYLEISKDDFVNFSRFMSVEIKQLLLPISECACGGICNCKR